MFLSLVSMRDRQSGGETCVEESRHGISMSGLANRFPQNGSWGFLRRVAALWISYGYPAVLLCSIKWCC